MTDEKREFDFRDADFIRVQKQIYDYAGIQLTEAKRHLVYNRLAKRIRQLNLTSFSAYLDFVEAHPDTEFTHLVNSITTNLTFFFREVHHFDALREQLIPKLKARHAKDKRLRVWSAGCSTGEEPYSIAITLMQAFNENLSGWDVKVLATDLDTNVLEHAQNGIYKLDKTEGIPEPLLKRWFNEGRGDNEGFVRAKDELKSLITFKPLNLMKEWPMKGPFDVIFCRNVVIYFDKPTQRTLFKRYYDLLSPGGYLIVGHSESLHNINNDFTLLGKTIYQKPE
jgi:chemotaxis protein methyltransferase CheR